jgi:MoxR-like ATPase
MPQARQSITKVVQAASQVILGKDKEIRLAVACLLAKGHLLIEDLPGVGKTTLAHTLAALLGLKFQRIQFTSDLLPADILGVSVFERERSTFRFVAGPVFTQLLLADEINRATPKTQSALLEAMEEQQVTVEGETRRLPSPFFVIATQNPSHQIGTFALPESQLDRFLMRLALGYPDRAAERRLLASGDARDQIPGLAPCLDEGDLPRVQKSVSQVLCADALLDYLHALLVSTRHSPDFVHGLSPRAGLALLAAARAWAFLDGREFVIPEDVQAVFPHVAGHRMRTRAGSSPSEEQLNELLHATAIP